MKKINNGEKINLGKKVVIIGAGNAAMDVILAAYASGAKTVTAIDIKKPSAFDKELNCAKSLGAKILYLCFTQKITEKGVLLQDSTLLEADSVIISIGDRPDFSFLNSEDLTPNGFIKLNKFNQMESNSKIFVAGDAIKQGLFVNALADGRLVANNIFRLFNSLPLISDDKLPLLPKDKVKPQFYTFQSPCDILKNDVLNEKNRCLRCGICRDCEFCLNACPQNAISKYINKMEIGV